LRLRLRLRLWRRRRGGSARARARFRAAAATAAARARGGGGVRRHVGAHGARRRHPRTQLAQQAQKARHAARPSVQEAKLVGGGARECRAELAHARACLRTCFGPICFDNSTAALAWTEFAAQQLH
jgi:hypothetical protein